MNKVSNIFNSNCTVNLEIDVEPDRKTCLLVRDFCGNRFPIFSSGEDIACSVCIQLKPGKKLEHSGVKIELIGTVETFGDRASNYDFYSISKELEPPGTMLESRNYHWKFLSVDMQHESYWGINVRVKYYIRLTVQRNFFGALTSSLLKDALFVVQNIYHAPEINNSIKMEVGVEDCVHIEFEYDKSKYHLSDVIIGKIYFTLVRLRIKSMEVHIIRIETTGIGSAATSESETLTKFEIMDGSPIRQECIPVRLYLANLDLYPTWKNVLNKLSVKYYINLVLIDETDRRFFKKQEIIFWRKRIG